TDGSGIGVTVESRRDDLGRTNVAVRELPSGIHVDHVPDWPLPTAASSEPRLAEPPLAPRHVEAVRRSGVLDQFDIGSSTAQPGDVGPAWLDGCPVVICSVEQPDRLQSDLVIVAERDPADRIECQIGREPPTARTVHPLEPLEAGVQGYELASRKAHDRDLFGVDVGP